MALTDSLVSYFKLDEASGTRNDSHGTNHLTDVNTVTQGAGKIGNAALFAAANNERLVITDAAQSGLDLTGSFTIAAWVNAATLPQTFHAIVTKGAFTAAGGGYALMHINQANDGFRLVIADGTNLRLHAGAFVGAMPTATWLFVVAWYDASDNSLHVQWDDGTDSSSIPTGTAPIGTAEEFRLGFWQSNAQDWDGLIDEVAIWSRVLTADERTSLYNGGVGLAYEGFFPPISTGDLAATDTPDTAAMAGAVLVEGALAALEAQDVAAFAGASYFYPAADPITGTRWADVTGNAWPSIEARL